MGRVRMDCNAKRYQSSRKAKDRKQRFLEIGKIDESCRCKMAAKEKNAFARAPKFSELPEEVVIEIMSYFSLKDLLRFRQVSKNIQTITDQSHVTWANVSFQSFWPKSKNVSTFEKAAECGNIECLAKLAFVSLYIYNFKGARKCMKTSLENANKAVAHFSKIDQLISPELPLTWMFIRPPWAYPVGVRKCLKECMVNKLEETCNSEEVSLPSLYNVGKTYLLKEEDVKEKGYEFFEKAAGLGCPYSKWELYKSKNLMKDDNLDAGVMLEAIRTLHDVASNGNFLAAIELCKIYSMPDGGLASKKAAVDCYRKVMDLCSPSGIHKILTNHPLFATKITGNMRCILVNWMHEVCDVKGMESGALHMAVDCLDRYLLNRPVNRKQLQLVGISCVVLASKVFSTSTSSLLTIRESAWLTDSTYEYNEVVRMLAEIIGVLKGKLFRMNTSHFGEIMSYLASFDEYNRHFLHYLIDSSLQFCAFGIYKPSLIAAAAALLTNIVRESANVWPLHMSEFTGYEVKHLANCVALLHTHCLLDRTAIVDGEHQISGARDRYSAVEYMEVAKRPVPDLNTVRSYIDDLEPRLRSELDNGRLRFHFKEEKNMLDPVNDTSATSSFLCGYDGDEEDNEAQSFCDTSLFYGKEQHRPSLDGFVPEIFCEETNKYPPKPFTDGTIPVETIPVEADSCACSPAKVKVEGKEVSVDKLTAAFSAACSCSSSASGRSGNVKIRSKLNVKKRPVYAGRRYEMQLRLSARNKQSSTLKADNENSERERRKRPANWPISHQSERKGTLRPKMDTKGTKKEPWRY